MNLVIREMGPKDYDAKGFIHYQTWRETYTGLMDEHYISNQTLEKCQYIARRWPQNTLVAEVDGTIVGFGCYILSEDGSGEISAIYILKSAQKQGIGIKLMDSMLMRMQTRHPISLWVLKGNEHAIGFYEHYGFHLDGTIKDSAVGTELRMILR